MLDYRGLKRIEFYDFFRRQIIRIGDNVEEFIKLLETFSGHFLMEEWKREKLFNKIRARLNKRQNQSVLRDFGAVLYVARRKD